MPTESSDPPRPRRLIASLQRRETTLNEMRKAGRANHYDRAELQALRWAIAQLLALWPTEPASTEKAPHDDIPRA